MRRGWTIVAALSGLPIIGSACACQRAWILTGTRVPVSPTVPASPRRDADDR
jgi:hypothetical protein